MYEARTCSLHTQRMMRWNGMKKKFGAVLLAGMMGLSVCSGMAPQNTQNAAAASGVYLEKLDRGISAVSTGSGMLVSWRFLANDPDAAIFKLYRDDTLVYTANPGDATCFLDAGGNASSKYKVETYSGTSKLNEATCNLTSGGNYFDVRLDKPGDIYSPNDCSVGDVDGDGVYELFVKWDPNNSQDNSKAGVTDKVYIDCYKLNGTKLWRIDLGVNIRAGAHYTQFLVADFDMDGKAEMTCKTADGTVDGTGKVIGNANANYRNSGGYILSGPEYYTLFDGATGAALHTVNYEHPRGEVSKSTWGDDYGNRCDRFLGSVVYLDGVKPSAVSVRGYYTRMTAVAYDVVDKKLVKEDSEAVLVPKMFEWFLDTGSTKAVAKKLNDAGAKRTANAGKPITEVKEQGVDERATGGAGRGMNHHAFGLVDDEKILVLVNDVQRDGLGRGFDRGRSREAKRNAVATAQHGFFVCSHAAIERNVSFFY